MTTEPDDQPDAEYLTEMARQRAEYDRTRAQEKEQEECDHEEHDHGICLYCAKDITDNLIAKAESAADARDDR